MNKIIFYIDSMRKGGANRVVSNLCNFFSEKGHEVVLVNDVLPSPSIPEYSVRNQVRRVYINSNIHAKLLSNCVRIYKLRKTIKNLNADVVVAFMGPPNIRMLISTLGLHTKKIVSVRNDPKVEYGEKGFTKKVKMAIFRLADGCVFQTEDAKMYFPEEVREKSRIIFNPVNPIFYKVDRVAQPHDVIAVGRLEPQKNHKLLIDAFSQVASLFPNEKLFIYGDGSLRKSLENYIERLGLGSRVFLPGATSDVSKRLSEAKVFVLSSDFEGMPNALMEAMAVGVPCISTDCPCGGPKNLIQADLQGVLIECGDSKSLASALKKVLRDGELQKDMSVAAKHRAEEFRSDLIFRQWDEYING